jgi:ribosomal protein L28
MRRAGGPCGAQGGLRRARGPAARRGACGAHGGPAAHTGACAPQAQNRRVHRCYRRSRAHAAHRARRARRARPRRSRRIWKPNVHKVRLYSEALDEEVQLKVSMHALRWAAAARGGGGRRQGAAEALPRPRGGLRAWRWQGHAAAGGWCSMQRTGTGALDAPLAHGSRPANPRRSLRPFSSPPARRRPQANRPLGRPRPLPAQNPRQAAAL